MDAALGPGGRARRRRPHSQDSGRPPRHHGAEAVRGGAAEVVRGDRAAEGPAPGGERLPESRDQGHAGSARNHRKQRRHPEGPPPGGAGRAHGFVGAHPRRDGHRQGTPGPGDPSAEPARAPRDGQGQLRRAAVGARGKRAVRPGERRLHRSAGAPGGPVRSGRRFDALPRRGRRTAGRRPGETPACAAGGRIRAGSGAPAPSRSTCA